MHVREAPHGRVVGEQEAHESQPPCLAAERATTDACEEADLGVEGVAVEVGHQGLALLPAILRDRGDQIVTQVFQAPEIPDLPRLELARQREFGARGEPVREVIALAVEGDALGWDHLQQLLQCLEIRGASHLAAVRHAEDEVAEREMLDHEVPEIGEQRDRVLPQERRADLRGPGRKLDARRLEQDGQVRDGFARHAGQLESRAARHLPAARKLHVGDETQHVRLVAVNSSQASSKVLDSRIWDGAHPHQLVERLTPR